MPITTTTTTRRSRARAPIPVTPARVLLLDAPASTGTPRAALVAPGRLPKIFPNLALALDAQRGMQVVR